MSTTHLDVEAELLKALEKCFFIAGNEGFEVRVNSSTHLYRLLLNLQFNTDKQRGVHVSLLGAHSCYEKPRRCY